MSEYYVKIHDRKNNISYYIKESALTFYTLSSFIYVYDTDGVREIEQNRNMLLMRSDVTIQGSKVVKCRPGLDKLIESGLGNCRTISTDDFKSMCILSLGENYGNT